jgi:penicillin-binding protein 1A
VLDGLTAYERRHGWKGHLMNVIAAGLDMKKFGHPDWKQPIVPGSYVHAMVLDVGATNVLLTMGRYQAVLGPAEIKWTLAKSPKDIFSVGDLAYVKVLSIDPSGEAKISLEQDSGAQGALLAIDNATGEVKAMVGGRDFDDSKFNRATQALRQTGSSFKPYVYTAAVEEGAMPDDVILDAPVTFSTSSGPYSPHNYDGKFEGNISLRHAFADSRNIPALKLIQRVGVQKVIEYARRFGITSDLPPVLPLALGAADVTLLEQTAAFSTFPNDGVRVSPHYIRKVEDFEGHVLEEDYPEVKDVISTRTARIMTQFLREVVLHGTAFSASKLNHPFGGKTGTTNDFTDAWFVGFSPSTTCGVWVGFDEKKTLGKKETGAQAALPIWLDFMKVAIAGKDKEQFPTPPPDTDNPKVAHKVAARNYPPGDGESH